MKNILHISDFHACDSPIYGMSIERLKKLASAMINDFRKLSIPDTIFITGDISYSGEKEEFDLFHTHFLMPLLNSCNLDIDRVLIVPGNHDSIRKHWKKSDKLMKKNLVDQYDANTIDEIFEEKAFDSECKWFSNFSTYRDFLDSTSIKKILIKNKFYTAYNLDGVGIGCINTAWLSFSDDYGNIMIGNQQLKEIFKHIKSLKQKILLHHHPLDWLHPRDREQASNQIHKSGVNAQFFGHMHSIKMTRESHFADETILKLQSGKMDINNDDEYSGYILLTLHQDNDFEEGTIYFRKIHAKNVEISPWTEAIKNGEFTYSLSHTVPFDSQVFSSICKNKLDATEDDLLCNIGLPIEQRRKLSNIFIMPTIHWDNAIVEEPISKTTKHIKDKPNYKFEDILNSTESIFVVGAENSGKSTLANKILIDKLREQSNENFSDLVFYVDCKDKIIRNVKKLREFILGYYFEDNDTKYFRSRIEKSLSENLSTIIFDHVEKLDSDSLHILFEYIKECPKSRYIILGQLSAHQILLELSSQISDIKKFKLYTIKSLKRSNIRELFKNWNNQASNSNNIVKNALSVVSGSGMPNNPFVYTMLLSIRDRKATAFRSFMHEADLVENFIEIIMHKHVYSNENSPQYKDLLLFLGCIAKNMHRLDSYSISENILMGIMIDFNNIISQDFSLGDYTSPILRSGILKKTDNGYSFSQICFLNYSYANWICKDTMSYEDLDTNLSFLRFDKVVEYVAAIKKSDVSLLKYINNQTKNAWDLLIKNDGCQDLTDVENEMSMATSHDIIDLLEEKNLEKPLIKKQLTQEDVDANMDISSPLNSSPISNVRKNQKNIPANVSFSGYLSLYSRVFRASEHILDADETLQHFNNIFELYIKFIAYNTRIFNIKIRPSLLDKILAAIDYVNMTQSQKNEAHTKINAFINFAIATVPNITVSMMTSDFFNERQLTRMKKTRKSTDNNLAKILLTYAICELGGVNIVEELKEQKYEKTYESSSLLVKVIGLLLYEFSITQKEKDELDKFVRKILKNRKTKQNYTNMSAISSKVYKHSTKYS